MARSMKVCDVPTPGSAAQIPFAWPESPDRHAIISVDYERTEAGPDAGVDSRNIGIAREATLRLQEPSRDLASESSISISMSKVPSAVQELGRDCPTRTPPKSPQGMPRGVREAFGPHLLGYITVSLGRHMTL